MAQPYRQTPTTIGVRSYETLAAFPLIRQPRCALCHDYPIVPEVDADRPMNSPATENLHDEPARSASHERASRVCLDPISLEDLSIGVDRADAAVPVCPRRPTRWRVVLGSRAGATATLAGAVLTRAASTCP
jgi:hypothetical protein